MIFNIVNLDNILIIHPTNGTKIITKGGSSGLTSYNDVFFFRCVKSFSSALLILNNICTKKAEAGWLLTIPNMTNGRNIYLVVAIDSRYMYIMIDNIEQFTIWRNAAEFSFVSLMSLANLYL